MFASEPLDVLYEALGEVMCAQEEDICYKTYLLVSLIALAMNVKDILTYNKSSISESVKSQPTGDAVSLAENVALISQGTTGLVTWEAALYLSEWALENTHIFKNKYT